MADHSHQEGAKVTQPAPQQRWNGATLPLTPAGLQRKELRDAIQQKKAAEMANFYGGTIQSPVQTIQRKLSSNPIGLPESVQGKMETAMGADFSSVQVHQNSSQAKELGALAYTQGENIHFAPGQFDAQSQQGQSLIGHELAHVVQQREGRVQPTTQAKGLAVNDDAGLEKEADEKGAMAAQMKAVDGDTGGDGKPNQRIAAFAPMQFYRVADPKDPFNIYKDKFNTLWNDPAYATLDGKFDDTLDSKGPRSAKARKIFESIYNADAVVKSAYDANADEIRFRIDNFNGPDGLNRTNSATLGALATIMTSATSPAGLMTPISAEGPNTTAGTLLYFEENDIKAAAEALSKSDTEEIKNNHAWTLLIEETAGSGALRSHLKNYLLRAGIGKPTVAPTTTAVKDESKLPKLQLTKDQQKFVENIDIKANPKKSTILAPDEKFDMEFWGTSNEKSTGLSLESEITVEPQRNVDTGNAKSMPWPIDSKKGDIHKIKLWNDPQVSNYTDFIATLQLRFPTQTDPYAYDDVTKKVPLKKPDTKFRLEDDRLNNFNTNLGMYLIFKNQGTTDVFYPSRSGTDVWGKAITIPATTMTYFGGRCPIAPYLQLADGKTVKNKGLPVEFDAEVFVGGASVFRFPRTPFGKYESVGSPNFFMLQETSPTSTDKVKMIIYSYPNADSKSAAFKTQTYDFEVTHDAGMTDGPFVTLMLDDTKILNEPETNAGSLRYDLLNATGAQAAQAKRTLAAINAGRIQVGSLGQRPGISGVPVDIQKEVVWTRGHTSLTTGNIVSYSFAQGPNVAGVRSAAYGGWIYVNRTVEYDSKGVRKVTRSNQEIMDFLIHESVHEMDNYDRSDWQRYQTEFRAYWFEGNKDRDKLSTAFDPSLDSNGPRTQRSREIFEHIKKDYTYVRNAYNTDDKFRANVNQLMFPDGVNVIVSVKLDLLWKKMEAYAGAMTAPDFTAHKTDLATDFAALTAEEARQISGNRAWRELVEKKYGATGTPTTEIKTLLKIPM